MLVTVRWELSLRWEIFIDLLESPTLYMNFSKILKTYFIGKPSYLSLVKGYQFTVEDIIIF